MDVFDFELSGLLCNIIPCTQQQQQFPHAKTLTIWKSVKTQNCCSLCRCCRSPIDKADENPMSINQTKREFSHPSVEMVHNRHNSARERNIWNLPLSCYLVAARSPPRYGRCSTPCSAYSSFSCSATHTARSPPLSFYRSSETLLSLSHSADNPTRERKRSERSRVANQYQTIISLGCMWSRAQCSVQQWWITEFDANARKKYRVISENEWHKVIFIQRI